jgi:uncharacterized protein YbjT (DUF2867 family)
MDKPPTSPIRTALLAGATGLVGRELLGLLLADEDYAAVHCLVRRALTLQHAKLICHQVDFSALGTLPAVDDVFIALGTTIKVAGSQAAFRAVDFAAVVAVAKAARASGATRLGVVSAMGASASSGVFYSRVKGEMERAVARLGYDAVILAQPSMLVGDRAALGQPVRSGEVWATRLTRPLSWLVPRSVRPIAAGDVAAALVQATALGRPGLHLLSSGDMQGAGG